VLISKGGNRWTVRKKSARTLDNVSITSVESQEFVENVYTFLRQAGLGSAVPIAIRPDTPEVSAAISLYGTVTSLQPTGAGKGTLPDHADEGLLDLMGITLGFEELV
jgi:hypothetical protein